MGVTDALTSVTGKFKTSKYSRYQNNSQECAHATLKSIWHGSHSLAVLKAETTLNVIQSEVMADLATIFKLWPLEVLQTILLPVFQLFSNCRSGLSVKFSLAVFNGESIYRDADP